MKPDANKESLSLIPKMRTLLGFGVSGFFVWLTLSKSGLYLRDITLQGAQWFYFFASILILVFSFWLYSLRARLIWKGSRLLPTHLDTYSSYVIGCFYNSILPGNLGEAMRGFHFSRKNKIPLSYSLAGIFTEKWLDAQVFAILAFGFLLMKPWVGNVISYAILLTGISVFTLAMIYYFLRRFRSIEKVCWKIILRFKIVGVFLFKLYRYTTDMLHTIRSNGNISGFIFFFALIFSLNMLQFFLLLKAAGIEGPVCSFYSAYLVALSMMIIAFIPSAPSSIGVLHYGLYAALILAAEQYGYKTSIADLQKYAVFGIYTHLSFFIPEILIGGFYVIKEKKVLFREHTFNP